MPTTGDLFIDTSGWAYYLDRQDPLHSVVVTLVKQAVIQRRRLITILRQVWIQQFYAEQEQAHWREAKDLPPSSLLICTPYDAEARYSQKRGMSWTGYKVHVTESCDEDGPHLVTDVQTTPAPV